MKRLISVLLCFVMLASLFACGRVEKPPVEPDPTPTVSPTPEQPTKEPDPVQTDSPTPEVTPPPGVIHTVDGYEIVYENEELDVTICSVDKGSHIVVHYGELTQEIENFPYNDMRPDFQVWEHDGDGDGTAELYIVHEVGSGTGESVCMLLVCEPNGDTLECLTHDWSEIAEEFNMSRVASYDETTGLVSVTYGERAVAAAADPGLNCKDPAAIFGNQVHYFRNEDGTVGLTFALELISEDHPMPEFYGMSLFLSLQFDGTDMIPVTKPQLGLDYGAKFAFSVTPTGVNKEFPDNFYETFLLNTPVGERSFTGCHVIGGNPIELHLADLTGDGADEFIVMLLPGWGSGPVKHDLHVFDGITLEEYDYNGTWSFLPELTAFTSDENYYYIDAANLLIPIAKKDVQALFPDAELLDTMEFRGEMCSLSAAYGKLFVTNWCMVNTWDTYGTLSASLVVKDGELTVDEVFYTAPDGTVTNERLIKDYFRAQLSCTENWYLAAMGSVFGQPAEMDLGLVFYGGFNPGDSGWDGFTSEEVSYLLEQGFYRNMSAQKMPAEQLDEILNTYFGISLYDAAIPSDWVYYPETDCYYSNHNDAYLVHGFTVMDIRETEDGLIEVHYCVDPLHGAFDPATGWPVIYGILTLRSNSGTLISSEGYTVISNLSAAPIDALAEEGVFLYALPDGSLFLQDEYSAGPVTYVNDINADHPGCYDLSLITITRKEFLYDWEGEPLYGVILLNLPSGEAAENVELRWAEETGTWEQAPFRAPGPLGGLPGEIVTYDTIPTDPKEFYKVGELPEEHLFLYARNHGQDSLLVWEGNFWWYLEGRIAHSTQFSLPQIVKVDDLTYGVISEVQTGTQVGMDELVVYEIDPTIQVSGSNFTGMRDHVYDWRPVAEEFNRSNTIVYDKDTNSIVLYWNGEVYFTGKLPEDQSAYLGLEDGFTGALIASGQIVRYEANEDGSFTVTMETCIGNGGDGSFSDDPADDPFWNWNGEENRYYPLSVGTIGLELSWTVNFTGEGFEASDVTVTQTGGATTLLYAALPSEEIYLFRRPGLENAANYLLVDGQVSILDSNQSFGDLIADFRLCDLDGDGKEELAVVGNFYAGSGYTSALTILDKTENGWGGCRFFPDGTASELMETAAFLPGADSNHVILSLEGFQFMFEVSNEVAARNGAYFASDLHLSTAITWDGEGYVLHLPGAIYRRDSSLPSFETSACDIHFELRCELNYDGSDITYTPMGITPPYTHFTVNQRGSGTFELVSEQGVVLFEGSHIRGEEILTYRRDLDLDGTEEFIVLLTSGRSDTSVQHDIHVFDGRAMEQVDTSGLWSVGSSLFVFFADDAMFHIHSGEFRQPLYKKDILARYPDIEFLDKVEFWGNRSSVSVLYDCIEVSYDCIVGEGGESFGSLRVQLKLEDGQLVPYRTVYEFDGQTKHHQLASNPIPGPFIGE